MIFFLSFLIMALIMAGMAVGAIAGRGSLKGSCGGLAAIGIEGRCDICGEDPGLRQAKGSAQIGHERRAQRDGSNTPGGTEFYDASR